MAKTAAALGTGTDADDVRARQRVAQQALEGGSAQTKTATCQHRDQRARQAQLADDEACTCDRLAPQHTQYRQWGDKALALYQSEAEGRHQDREQAPGFAPSGILARFTQCPHLPVAAVAAVGAWAQGRQVGPVRVIKRCVRYMLRRLILRLGCATRRKGSHSDFTLWRRTIQRNTGAPTSAVMMPTSSSAGRAISRPAISADVSNSAPASADSGTTQR